MNKSFLLGSLLFLLMISFVSADYLLVDDFNSSIEVGFWNVSTSNFNWGSGVGINGSGGVSSTINQDSDLEGVFAGFGNVTACIYMNDTGTTTAGKRSLLMFGNNVNTNAYWGVETDQSTTHYSYFNLTTTWVVLDCPRTTGWVELCIDMGYPVNNIDLYANGVFCGGGSYYIGVPEISYKAVLDGSYSSKTSLGYDFDRFVIWEGSYADKPSGSVPANISAPVFISPSPANNSHNNTQATFNINCSDGLVNFWFNETKVIINGSRVSNYTTAVVTNKAYNATAGCYNATAGGWSSNVSRVWYFDDQSPTNTINPLNLFYASNYSQGDPYKDIVNLNFTLFDNIELYAYLINITNAGIVYYNETNESISGTNFTYNKALNVTGWADGVYTVELTVTDSHTANVIPDYQVTKKKSSITFKPGNDNNIKIETGETSTIEAVKMLDRYVFEVSFDDKTVKDRLFHVKTDKCPLVYRPDSGYKAHFVSYCEGSGNWIDFEGSESDYVVTKKDNFHYEVLFFDMDPDITFESIGGLNSDTFWYSFYLGSYDIIESPDPVSLNASINLGLNLTLNGAETVFNASLWVGAYEYIPERSNVSGYVYFNASVLANVSGVNNYHWNITFTNPDLSTFQVTSAQTFTAFAWNLNNCSGGNVTFIMNSYDENIPADDLNVTVEAELKYWVSDVDVSKYLQYSQTNANTFHVCLNPANQTFYADLYVQYESDAFTHRYYWYNRTLTNTSFNISMYNFNETTGVSNLEIVSRDRTSYSFYSDVLAKLQRRYLSEGVWRTVQMDQSGDFGTLFFNIKEEDTDYRLLYYDLNNNLLKQTASLKFVCASSICELTQLLDPYTSTSASTSLVVVHAFNNDTSILNVNWSDPLGGSHTVKTRVSKETLTGALTICDVSQLASSGTVNCNLTGYTGDVLLTVLTSNSPYTPIVSQWIRVAGGTLGGLITQVEGAFWSIAIIVTTVALGLASPVASILGALFGLIIIAFMGLFNPITLTFVIIAVVMGVAIGIKVRQ